MKASEKSTLAADARTERQLVVVGLTDPQSMLGVIWPAFQREIAPWAELDYTQDVVPARVLARLREPQPGVAPVDVVTVGNPAAFTQADQVVEPFEQPDAQRYPAGWCDPGSQWIPLYVQPVVGIYNHHHVRSVPAGWGALADGVSDSHWTDRFVCEEPWRMISTGPALSELDATLGGAATAELMAGLAAGQPLLVGDNERSVLEVATGSRWVGLSIWNVARRVRVGSPVRHIFFEPTPCVPGFGMLARGGTSPSLARLFLAWLGSSGGQRAFAETGRIPALPDLDVPTALARILPPGITPVFGTGTWLSQPQHWVERLRHVFKTNDVVAPAGKLV